MSRVAEMRLLPLPDLSRNRSDALARVAVAETEIKTALSRLENLVGPFGHGADVSGVLADIEAAMRRKVEAGLDLIAANHAWLARKAEYEVRSGRTLYAVRGHGSVVHASDAPPDLASFCDAVSAGPLSDDIPNCYVCSARLAEAIR